MELLFLLILVTVRVAVCRHDMPSRKRATAAAPKASASKKPRLEVEQHSGGSGRTGSFSALTDPKVPPHTLLLGTQPSTKSIDKGWYFGSDALRSPLHCYREPGTAAWDGVF